MQWPNHGLLGGWRVPILKAKLRRLGAMLLAVTTLAVLGAGLWSLGGTANPDGTGAIAASGSESLAATKIGPSGQPVPRFVSLKNDVTNVRRGPSSEHDLAYVYRRKGLPVEIVAEFEHWRRIRDSDGDEGWVYRSLLSGKRTALVAPWKPGSEVPLQARVGQTQAPVARLASGAMVEVDSCDGAWCNIQAGGYEGFVEQKLLFGVYPGERLDD